MAFLYLIRHPKTLPDPAVPASLWRLAPEGSMQVETLVSLPLWSSVAAIYTSSEPKTTAVGMAVHDVHNILFSPVADLGEARRDVWVGGEAFYTAQADFFTQTAVPPIPGWESADAAQARFVAAMNRLLSDHAPTDSLVIVSHATVLTLYAAHLRGSAPSYREWHNMGFAAIMAVDRTALTPVTSFLVAPYEGLPYM